MSKTPTPAPDDSGQSKRFEEAARAVEADESGAAFERAVNAVLPTNAERTTSDDSALTTTQKKRSR